MTLIDTDVAATVTAQTPDPWDSPVSPAALSVGGTSASGYNASAEGTITASRLFDVQQVNPQTGYSIWFPTPPRVAASRFLRIRALFGATVNCVPWILFQEPA